MLENEDSRKKRKKERGGVRIASWDLLKEQEASLGDSEENARTQKQSLLSLKLDVCQGKLRAWLFDSCSVLKEASPMSPRRMLQS